MSGQEEYRDQVGFRGGRSSCCPSACLLFLHACERARLNHEPSTPISVQELTNPAKYPETAAAEVEYRAAMGLPPDDPAFGQVNPTDPKFGTFEEGRVLYPSTIE